jgi:hypothetical protein
MYCPICGDTQFRFEEDEIDNDECQLECLRCGLIITKADLIERNANSINAEVEAMKQEVLHDVRRSLQEAVKGNKNIRIK